MQLVQAVFMVKLNYALVIIKEQEAMLCFGAFITLSIHPLCVYTAFFNCFENRHKIIKKGSASWYFTRILTKQQIAEIIHYHFLGLFSRYFDGSLNKGQEDKKEEESTSLFVCVFPKDPKSIYSSFSLFVYINILTSRKKKRTQLITEDKLTLSVISSLLKRMT